MAESHRIAEPLSFSYALYGPMCATQLSYTTNPVDMSFNNTCNAFIWGNTAVSVEILSCHSNCICYKHYLGSGDCSEDESREVTFKTSCSDTCTGPDELNMYLQIEEWAGGCAGVFNASALALSGADVSHVLNHDGNYSSWNHSECVLTATNTLNGFAADRVAGFGPLTVLSALLLLWVS